MQINKGGKGYQPAPKGKHQARCVSIVDMGTQPGSTQYPEPKRKIRFGFELLGQETSEGKALVAYREMTLSNWIPPAKTKTGKKNTQQPSALMLMLKDWMDVEDREYEIENVLGEYAMITVVHTTSKGRVYDNVDDVQPLHKKPISKGKEPLKSFYMDEPPLDMETFESLPDWLQTKIASSPEFKRLSEAKAKKKKK